MSVTQAYMPTPTLVDMRRHSGARKLADVAGDLSPGSTPELQRPQPSGPSAELINHTILQRMVIHANTPPLSVPQFLHLKNGAVGTFLKRY